MIEKLTLRVPGGNDLEPVAGMPGGEGQDTLNSVLPWATATLFAVATLLALAFLIWGGIQWITSGGDKTAIETARKKIMYAVIGLVITFLAFLIMNTLSELFGVNLFPGAPWT